MNVLSLFAGIGGLDLGLERAGMTVVGQVEIDPLCQRVLAKHWPEVPRHDDVRTAVEWWLGRARPAVDVVCGGFPCQPFSTAGRQQGIADERWGWPWFWDVVRMVRPGYVLVENVAALIADRRAFGSILTDLAAGGYDAEWDCVPAASVGAPHLRDRLFLVAYAQRDELWEQPVAEPRGGGPAIAGDHGATRTMADTHHEGQHRGEELPARRDPVRQPSTVRTDVDGRRGLVADADSPGSSRRPVETSGGSGAAWRLEPQRLGRIFTGQRLSPRGHWASEPDVGRVAHGVPQRVDRLRALGNAVVPQVAEHIGRLVMAALPVPAGALTTRPSIEETL